jgi:hypothetical protein
VLTKTGRVRIRLAAGVIALAAAVGAWALWPVPSQAPQARRYLDVSACLLTGPGGIAPGTSAAPVWTAMESASLVTHVMVTYLSDTGPTDVGPMLNTLIERQCGVIIATGDAAPDVVAAGKANPHQQFLLVAALNTGVLAQTPNTAVVSPADAAGRIDHLIRALAANATPPGS